MNDNERKITVRIRNNETGEIVEGSDFDGYFDKKTNEFCNYVWSDGNFACDCNRDLFFHRAKGLDDPEEPTCGEEKYSIQIVDPSNGKIVYDEF